MSRSVSLVTVVALLAVVCIPWPALAAGARTLTPAAAVKLALDERNDGSIVTVQGEAIGESLAAPDGMRWVNVLGNGTALGVVMTEAEAEAIPAYGAYRVHGSVLRVEGVLNSACDDHGGDLDLHAVHVGVIDPGEIIPHAVHPLKLVFTAAASAVTLILWANYRRLRRRSYLA